MDILEMASKLARIMYTNEFCAGCGGAIAIDEAENVVLTGDGENKATTHKNCSIKKTAEKTWTYQLNNV